MCYPKPGPRCSAHAAKQVARAQHAALIYLDEQPAETKDWGAFEKLSSALKAARAEYAITPAGIKALERLAVENPDVTGYQLQLTQARLEREHRLGLLRADQRRERRHRATNRVSMAYSNTKLAVDGDTLAAFKLRHQDVKTLLAESEAWAAGLTADEIATARWYSEGGYEDINGGLNGIPHRSKTRARGDYQTAVKHLDTAIAKMQREQPVITYRRHFFYKPTGEMLTMTTEEQRARFPVGSIYKPGFYMSTSIDPANARQGNAVAALQIKTRRGAPLPAIANQGVGEKEILLPRDGTYRVVANDTAVTITDTDGKPYTINIIQLEEVPA